MYIFVHYASNCSYLFLFTLYPNTLFSVQNKQKRNEIIHKTRQKKDYHLTTLQAGYNIFNSLKSCISSTRYPCAMKVKSRHWSQDKVSGTVTVNNHSNINYDSSAAAQYPVDIVKCLKDTSVTTTSILRFVHGYPPNAAFCLEDINSRDEEEVIELLKSCANSSYGTIFNGKTKPPQKKQVSLSLNFVVFKLCFRTLVF